jgi:hypothetical protein
LSSRLASLAGDARKHYETREHVLVEDRKALKFQLEEALTNLRQERAAHKVKDTGRFPCGEEASLTPPAI